MSSSRSRRAPFLSRPRLPSWSSSCRTASSSSRSLDRPASLIQRSRFALCEARLMICSTRSAFANDGVSACSSRRSRSGWRRTCRIISSRSACACGTCTPTSTPSSGWKSYEVCAWASSTYLSESICYARVSISRKSPSSPFSMRTRKVSCAAIDR